MLCLYLEWISFLFIFTSLWLWLSNFIHYFLVAEVSASRITHTLDLINLIFSIRVLLFEFASPIWDFTVFQLLFRFHSVSIRWIFLRFLERCLCKVLDNDFLQACQSNLLTPPLLSLIKRFLYFTSDFYWFSQVWNEVLLDDF